MATSGVETNGDFLLVAVTFIGIVFSALLLIWQVGRQFRNALELQQQNFKDQLGQEIYSEFSDAFHEYNHLLVTTQSMVSSVPSDFSMYLSYRQNNLPTSPIKARDHLIRESKSEASKAVIKVIHLLEKYEIMLPKLTVAKQLLGEELRKFGIVFTSFHNVAVRYVPIQVPKDQVAAGGKTVVSLKEIDADAVKELEKLAADYATKCTEFTCYMYDFWVIMQNEILGHLFDKKLEGRKQRSDSYVIIKADDDPSMVELKNKLLEDGFWGKTLQRVYHGVNQYGIVDAVDIEDEPENQNPLK